MEVRKIFFLEEYNYEFFYLKNSGKIKLGWSALVFKL